MLKDTFKQQIKRTLGVRRAAALRSFLGDVHSRMHAHDLARLAEIHNSDKWRSHWYAQHYQRHFRERRKQRLAILEIGVGGYDDPYAGGNSLQMWKYFFPNSMIYGIDIHEKRLPVEKRIKIFRGSQVDAAFLSGVVEEIGPPDIIIDDGSHLNEHVVKTFAILFPSLNSKGIYVVEDTQTSYWPDKGGDSLNLQNPSTSMAFFKGLADGLNYKEFLRPGYVPSYYDQHIVGMHFYHNMVFIYKGDNNEESNGVMNNQLDVGKQASGVGYQVSGVRCQASAGVRSQVSGLKPST